MAAALASLAAPPSPLPKQFDPTIERLPLYMVPGNWQGMVKPGNIDIAHRPNVLNPDGSHSSVLSVSFGIGGHEVLVPRVVNGRVVSSLEALAHYRATGQNLGVFVNPAAADAYAQALHLEQAKSGPGQG